MGRKQPPRGGSSGAIAWLALFFSLVSCLLSLATFLGVNQDGRLSQHWAESSRQLSSALREAAPSASAPGPAEEDRDSSASVAPAIDAPAGANTQAERWNQMQGKIDRLQTMIHTGDARARYYIDMLRDDLQGTSGGPSTVQRAAWLIQALQALQRIDEQLSQNAPEAARRPQGLAQELRLHLGQPTPAGEAALSSEEPEPEPAEAAGTPVATSAPIQAAPRKTRPVRGKLAATAPAAAATANASRKELNHD